MPMRGICVVSLIIVAVANPTATAAEILWTHGTTGGYLDSSAAVGDVDRDGSPDIVVTTTVGPVIALDASGREIWRTDVGEPITIAPTLADVAGDPALEVLVLAQSGRLLCLEGLTGDIFWENSLLGGVKWGCMTVLAVDLDGDGAIEVIAGDEEGGLVCASGGGETLWTYEEPEGIASALAAGDLDGDGIAEIVLASEESPVICVSHEGRLLWRFQPEGMGSLPGRKSENTAPVIWDLNGDGAPEIVAGVGPSLVAVNSEGEGLWSYPMANRIDSAISVADADGDGQPEVYAADLSGSFVCVTGRGEERWKTTLGARARRAASIADVDGDGVVEILVAGYGGRIQVFGPAGVLEEELPLKGGTNAAVTLADLLGDGSLCGIVPTITGELIVYRWEPCARGRTVLWPEYRCNASRTASPHPPGERKPGVGFAAIELGNYSASSSAVRLRIGNPERRALSAEVSVMLDGETLATELRKSARRRINIKVPYTLDESLDGRLRFRCALTEGQETIEEHLYEMERVSFVRKLAGLEETFGELDGLLPQLANSDGLKERVCYLASETDGLRASVEGAASLSAMERRALRDSLVQLEEALSRLGAVAKRAAGEARVLVAYGANPWAPFGGMDEILEDRTLPSKVDVEAFRGEFESAAINVYNFSGQQCTVQVAVDNLAGSSSVPADGVFTLREVIDVPTQMADLAADALPRLGEGNTLVLPPWGGRQLWVTVDTSALEPGSWQTSVHFRGLDVERHDAAADVALTIWETPLPEEQALRLCHWSGTSEPPGTLEDQIAHGTSVFTGGIPGRATFDAEGNLVEVDYTDHDAFMIRHAPHGIVLFHSIASLSGPAGVGSSVWQKAFDAFVSRWVKHLAKLGFDYDDFAFYPVDEPGLEHGSRVAVFMQWAEIAHKADPRIQMYANPVGGITVERLEKMVPYVDIWAPLHTAIVPEEELALIHSTDSQRWNYSCADNAKHQSPLGYYRGQAWMCWHFGHTGIGFFAYHLGGRSAWLPSQGHLDYSMVYTGRQVVTSKRWEAVRDGVEDYAMLAALRAAADEAEEEGLSADAVAEARLVCGEQAEVIARFCSWDDDGTVPGKDGLRGVRVIADKRWGALQAIRRDMARLLDELTEK